jgi:hypothetical protein
MANALFIGWGLTIAGREQQSLQVFSEAIQYWDQLVQQGEVESYETYQLDPHGGDLAGFLIARGDPEKLAHLRMSDEFNRINLRAQLVVHNFGVVGARTGQELQQLFQLFGQFAQELA